MVSFGGFCTGEIVSDKGLILPITTAGMVLLQLLQLLKSYLKNGF
ncbi:S46 family peptidase [Chryseobacterium indoltheticum]